LLFVDIAGHVVHSGYHLTEIKAANFETVDCGGQVNHWRETILQLWAPQDADGSYMSTGKVLKIFDKVGGLVPLDGQAEVRVEYGDENFSRRLITSARSRTGATQPASCSSRRRRRAKRATGELRLPRPRRAVSRRSRRVARRSDL
jgi:hypothetical protein